MSCDVAGEHRSRGEPVQTRKDTMTLLIPVHKDQKPFKCGLCSFSFDIILQLDTHISEHSLTKPFQCGFCQASFNSSSELTVHVDTHRLFMCVAKGPFTENLRIKAKTTGDFKSTESSLGTTKGRPAISVSAPYKATAFTSKSQGRAKQPSRGPVPVKVLTKRAGQYSCTVCGQSFKRVVSLKKHSIAEHADDRPFHCEWCPSRFKQNIHLIDHMNSVHRSCKPYVCPFCGDRFKIKSYLRHHVDRRHGMDSASSVHPRMKQGGEGTEEGSEGKGRGSERRGVSEAEPCDGKTVCADTAGRQEAKADDAGRVLQEGVQGEDHPLQERDRAENRADHVVEEDEALPHSFLTTTLGTVYTVPQSSSTVPQSSSTVPQSSSTVPQSSSTVPQSSSTVWNITQEPQLDMKVEMDFDSTSSSNVAQDPGPFIQTQNLGTGLQPGSVSNIVTPIPPHHPGTGSESGSVNNIVTPIPPHHPGTGSESGSVNNIVTPIPPHHPGTGSQPGSVHDTVCTHTPSQ